MIGLAVAFTLGKMPAETEKVGIVVMFKVGNGRLEKGRLVTFGGTRFPSNGYPELGDETVELRILWLATGRTVIVSVVVPPVIVVVPRVS